ncbi:hypothetical protein E8K88_11360 [Lampropedia aestuarii]|uniref:Uncharacterized protein n=1 Tax=Lampropedia aestuarii TaxID=2562762 RepID=A0A4S5BNU4_9BURK|nr:hypothetical protein [Lampropedia aestuarii]THJ32575.1 hypothetical protein E8K88_11360 [Lampropedia aestuarii]
MAPRFVFHQVFAHVDLICQRELACTGMVLVTSLTALGLIGVSPMRKGKRTWVRLPLDWAEVLSMGL